MNIRFHVLKNAVLHNGKSQAGAIVPKLLGEDPSLKSKLKDLMPEIKKIVNDVNNISLEEQKKELLKLDPHVLDKKEEVRELPEIEGIKKGKCSFRLPPGPEKQLHIGHALNYLLINYYAKKYNGKLILRFEDTNANKCAWEYVKGNREDLKALGITWDDEYFLSDQLPEYYKLAEKMIKNGDAYSCICPKKEEGENKFEKKRCKCAENDVNWSLRHWNKMKYGTYREGECVLRLKGDMNSKNTVMWDPILFRINKTKHYRQGGKFFIWPMYDFTASVEDAKITHVLRDSNWTQRIELQDYIRSKLGLKNNPVNILYSRYQVEDGITKGREIRRLVDEKIVSGYDDIRLTTVKAFLRRGIQVQTLMDLIVELGISKSKRTIPVDKIYSINRKLLFDKVKHFQAIKSDESMKLKINNCPKEITINNEKIDLTGEFIINKISSDSKNIRLKNAFNVEIESIKNGIVSGKIINGEIKKGMIIINWITSNNNNIKVLKGHNLFDDKGEINPNSLEEIDLIIEKSANDSKVGSIVEFEKFGFCKKEENQWIFCHD